MPKDSNSPHVYSQEIVMKQMFLVAALCCSIVVAGAQTTAKRQLSLDEAIKIALEQNINVRQAYNNMESAQSGVLSAYGLYMPTLSANGGWTRQQTERPASTQFVVGVPIEVPATSNTQNSFSAGLSAGYTLFDGFSREANFNRAVSNAVAAEQTSTRTRQQIVYQVQSLYLNVLRNEQLVKVSEENLKRDQRQLERITESNRVGASSVADVYRQQSIVANDELNLISAQNNYDKAVADLLSLIGVDVGVDYAIMDPTITTTIEETELKAIEGIMNTFGQSRERALSVRPDYQSALASYDASESGVTAASSRYYPSINAFAGYNLSSTQLSTIQDQKGINWGLNIRWTLFDGFQTNQSIQQASATKRNAELTVLQAERNISVDVKKALLDLEAARKQYEASEKSLLSATQDRRVAEERYNLGAGTLLDLLTANANYVNSQASKVNATYNFIISRKNLEYAMGEQKY